MIGFTSSALCHVTAAALWRRKKSSFLLVLVAALSVFTSLFLHNLTARQEAAMDEVIRNTDIHCIVTSAQGTNTDHLRMPHPLVDRLMGRRHEYGNYQDKYVKNVRALSSITLLQPEGITLRRILNFASDTALSVTEGSEIRMMEGWTEEAFLTEQAVCLIPAKMESQINEDGRQYVTIFINDGIQAELQVIGTVSGGSGEVIWCPFYMQLQDGITELKWVDSCSFDIADNTKLEESKTSIYEVFVEPKMTNLNDGLSFGVLVQDETYQNTLQELQSNPSLLRLLLPILTILSGCIGFLAGYLTTRGRIREFAVMRCLGMKRFTVFALIFGEYVLLSAIGAVIGGIAGFLMERADVGNAIVKAGMIVGLFLVGAAISVGNVTNINVIKLTKLEE